MKAGLSPSNRHILNAGPSQHVSFFLVSRVDMRLLNKTFGQVQTKINLSFTYNEYVMMVQR